MDAATSRVYSVASTGRKLCNVLARENSDADGRGRHKIVLEPYGYRWYRVGGLGYLLDRTEY